MSRLIGVSSLTLAITGCAVGSMPSAPSTTGSDQFSSNTISIGKTTPASYSLLSTKLDEMTPVERLASIDEAEWFRDYLQVRTAKRLRQAWAGNRFRLSSVEAGPGPGNGYGGVDANHDAGPGNGLGIGHFDHGNGHGYGHGENDHCDPSQGGPGANGQGHGNSCPPPAPDGLQHLGIFDESALGGSATSQTAFNGASNFFRISEPGISPHEAKRRFELQQVFLNGLTSPMSGDGAGDGTGKTWWVTEGDGTNAVAFKYATNSLAAATPEFLIPTGDHFVKNRLLVINRIGYIVSKEGNFFILDCNTASPTYGQIKSVQPVNGGAGNSPNVGFTGNTFADFGTFNGTSLAWYVVNNTGVLYRLRINIFTGAVVSTESLQLPRIASPSFEEFYASGPIVFNNRLTIGSWKRHGKPPTVRNPAFDLGHIRTYILHPTNLAASTLQFSTQIPDPILVDPSPDIDGNGITQYVFAPAGDSVFAVDPVQTVGSAPGFSVPLVINPGDPASGNPTGLVDPTRQLSTGIKSRVVLDPFNPYTVYVSNCNAFWKIDFSSSYDATANPYNHTTNFNENFEERKVNFAEPTTTWYASTVIGQGSGPVGLDGKYVYNDAYPLINLSFSGDAFLCDANSNDSSLVKSTSVSANRFVTNHANRFAGPMFTAGALLPPLAGASGPQVQAGGVFIGFENNPRELTWYTRAQSGAPPAAQLWAWSL